MQTVHCSHHVDIIISAWLNKMLVCCHPTVINQLGLVDWREVCFAWPQPIDRFIYLFFLWHWHRWKNFSWISCYQTGFVRQHQTNNSLSFCDKLINSYSLPTIFWKWLIWIMINLGVSWDIWEVVFLVEFNVTLVHNCVCITSFLCDLFL